MILFVAQSCQKFQHWGILTRLILTIFVLLIVLCKIMQTKAYKGCTKSKTLRLRYLQYSSNRPTAQSQHFISTSHWTTALVLFPVLW